MSSWIKACEIKTLNNGEMFDFDHDDKKILIMKMKNRIYATDRICTHAFADLSTGFLNEDDNTVTCPLHMSRFNIQSGVPGNFPRRRTSQDLRNRGKRWVGVCFN